MAGVFSGQRVPADPQHLQKHLRAVSEGMNAGASAMSPGDRDLGHFESRFAGEDKDFGIESPAFDSLMGENGAHRRLLEGFEPALRVFEFQAEGEAQQKIEDAA